MAIPSGLLADAKTYLNITWTDTATDTRITMLCQSGMAYIDDILGEGADYMAPGDPRTLLFEYVRYGRDEALEVFEENYRHRLLAMQNNKAVIYHETTETA